MGSNLTKCTTLPNALPFSPKVRLEYLPKIAVDLTLYKHKDPYCNISLFSTLQLLIITLIPTLTRDFLTLFHLPKAKA